MSRHILTDTMMSQPNVHVPHPASGSSALCSFLLLKTTALLRYNSDIVSSQCSPPLKCTIQLFSFKKLCIVHHYLTTEHLHHPRKNAVPFSSHFPFLPKPPPLANTHLFPISMYSPIPPIFVQMKSYNTYDI